MIKYVKDVDTGELYPINADSKKESINNTPDYVKDDFPEIHVNYSGENGTNDVILELSEQLREEKASKTVIHKYPIAEILCAAALIAVMVVGVVFGVRFVSNVEMQPITVQYNETVQEDVPTEQEPEQNESQGEDDITAVFENLLTRALPLAITVVGVRFAVKFLHHVIEVG